MPRSIRESSRKCVLSATDDTIVYSASHATGILLALAGMAFQWAFLHSITFLGTVAIPQGAATTNGGGWIANSLCTFAVFLSIFLTAKQGRPLSQQRWSYRLTAGCIAVGLTVLLAFNGAAPAPFWTYAGNVLIAFGSAPLIIMWGELYQYLNPQREQLLVTATAAVLAIALYLIEILLPPILYVLMLIALPCGSIVCLKTACSLLRNSSDTWHAAEGPKGKRSPLLLFVCIAVFSIPYNYLRNTEQLQSVVSDPTAWPSVLAIAVVAITAMAVAEYGAERRGIVVIPIFVLVLMSAALLVHLIAPAPRASIVPSLLYSGYYLFLAMIYLSIGPLAATAEENPTRLFSEAMIFNVAGLLLGSAIAAAEAWLGASSATLTALVLTYTILLTGIALLGNRSYSLFRINSLDEEEYSFEYVLPRPQTVECASPKCESLQPSADEATAPSPTMLDAIVEQCSAVGQHYHLSSREQEVLVDLVRGRTIASIADTLTVSENTVKAHTKGIYRKLDVHTREELLAQVEKTGQPLA